MRVSKNEKGADVDEALGEIESGVARGWLGKGWEMSHKALLYRVKIAKITG